MNHAQRSAAFVETVLCPIGLATRERFARADLNGDGTPNGLDTQPFGAALIP